MRYLRNQETHTEEKETAPNEEEAKETESYVFVFQSPDGRTCQTEEETNTRPVTELEHISNFIVGVVIFGRLLVRSIQRRW